MLNIYNSFDIMAVTVVFILICRMVIGQSPRVDDFPRLLQRLKVSVNRSNWQPFADALDHNEFKKHCLESRQSIISTYFLERFPKHPRQIEAYQEGLLTLCSGANPHQDRSLGHKAFVWALQHRAFDLAIKIQHELGLSVIKYQLYFECVILKALQGDDASLALYLKNPDENIVEFVDWLISQRKWPQHIERVLQPMCHRALVKFMHMSELVKLTC